MESRHDTIRHDTTRYNVTRYHFSQKSYVMENFQLQIRIQREIILLFQTTKLMQACVIISDDRLKRHALAILKQTT